MNIGELTKKAVELAGREIDIEPTRDGRYVVPWFNANGGPSPKGETECEALEKFITFLERNKENIDEKSGT